MDHAPLYTFTSTTTLRTLLGTLNEEARKGWDCSARLAIVVAKELHRRAAESIAVIA